MKGKRCISAKKLFLKDAEILKDILSQSQASKSKQRKLKLQLIPKRASINPFEEQIIKLQSFFRMSLYKTRYRNMKKSALVIQKFYRMFVVRRLYK